MQTDVDAPPAAGEVEARDVEGAPPEATRIATVAADMTSEAIATVRRIDRDCFIGAGAGTAKHPAGVVRSPRRYVQVGTGHPR